MIGVNVVVAACATTGYLALASFARRYPEAVLFVILVVVDLATIGVGMLRAEMGATVAGYLLVLPMVVALVLPWATRIHVGVARPPCRPGARRDPAGTAWLAADDEPV